MKCFDNYYRKNNIKINITEQIGGGTLKFKYKDEEIKFKKYIDKDNDIDIYLHTLDNKENCIVITIINNSKIGYIKTINSNFGKCLNGNKLDNNGITYIKICIELLKKYKNEFKINKIILSDDAEFYCDKITTIKLSNLIFLQYGDSFYGRFGFIPDKKSDRGNYKSNKKKLNKIKTKDLNLKILLDNYKNKINNDLIIKLNKKYIKYLNKNIKRWFNKISRILSKENCNLLFYLVEIIFIELKLYPIDNILYTMNI